MNKKTTAIILIAAVVIIVSFGGYKAYAKHLDQQQYQEAQTSLNALFKDKSHRILSRRVNKAMLQAVQDKIENIADKVNKARLKKELNNARNMLKTEEIANKDVSAILKDGILEVNVTSSQLEKTKKLVSKLTDKTLKADLEKTLDEASQQFSNQTNALKAVTSLFVDGTHTTLADSANRDLYNHAKELADVIKNEQRKNELTDLLAKADELLSKAEKEQAEAKVIAEAQNKPAASTAQPSSNPANQQTVNSGSNGSIQTNGQQEIGFARIVANSKTAQRTDQIVTVVASGTTAKVTLWEKNSNVWSEIITTSGFVGSQGVGQASEGSKRTPRGSYSLGFAFGQSNPGTLLPFRQITSNSYWISDVNSNLYNTWQEGTYAGNGNEHLADYENLQYYYAIVINYNMNAVKGAGSAFFLHVSSGRPTAGCVSVPKSVMEQFMKRIHSGAWIINVTSENEVANY